MKQIPYTLLLTAVLGLSSAQADVVKEAPQTPPEAGQQAGMAEGEQRLRSGIVMLGTLCQCMASIKDNDTAEAAVPQIMRLRDELQKWTQAFTNLPPLTDAEIQLYEERYIPTIRKINRILETQADRLAAAEYYGSKNLAAALVHIAQVGH